MTKWMIMLGVLVLCMHQWVVHPHGNGDGDGVSDRAVPFVPFVTTTQSPRDALLTSVVDAEIQATQAYVNLLQTKAALLQRMIHIEQTHLNKSSTESTAVNDTSFWHRPSRKHVHEQLTDWLAPQGTWLSPTAAPASLHVELISFRPNINLGGKRNGHGHSHSSRQGSHDPTVPIVQFLMVLHTHTGLLELFHPTTQALLWQQHLEIPSPIRRVAFHSDRASHLVLVTQSNSLLVYKWRVFHGRRLIAGDYRRHSGKETPRCSATVRFPNSGLQAARDLMHPFVMGPRQRTSAPHGLHTHFDMEFEFAAMPSRNVTQLIMVASHQSLFLVTSSDEGYLGFYDGHNGSFLGELDTWLGRMAHFQTLSSGVVAFAAQNRVHFIDVFDRRLLGLTCEGSRYAITSLQRDVWRHTALYAGTSDGKGLAFRLNRFGSLKRNNGLMPIGADAIDPFDDSDLGFPTCTVTALLQPRARIFDSVQHPASVQRAAIVTAMPGHVLLTTPAGHLVLYDTSTHPGIPAYLAEKSIAKSLPIASEVVSVHAGKDPHAGTSAVAIAIIEHSPLSRVRVELLAARLSPVSSGLEISWIRAPMMLLCAFGVMFWQQNRYRRAPSSLADFELPNAGRHNRQYGRRGVSDWSRPANRQAFSGR